MLVQMKQTEGSVSRSKSSMKEEIDPEVADYR